MQAAGLESWWQGESRRPRHQLNYESQFINHYVLWIITIFMPSDPSHFKIWFRIWGGERYIINVF